MSCPLSFHSTVVLLTSSLLTRSHVLAVSPPIIPARPNPATPDFPARQKPSRASGRITFPSPPAFLHSYIPTFLISIPKNSTPIKNRKSKIENPFPPPQSRTCLLLVINGQSGPLRIEHSSHLDSPSHKAREIGRASCRERV